MPRRSARLIYAYWDDREESLGEQSRRRSRRSEHMRDLPELWCDAITWERRTVYSYGKRVRAKGMTRVGMNANNRFTRTTSTYRSGGGGVRPHKAGYGGDHRLFRALRLRRPHGGARRADP